MFGALAGLSAIKAAALAAMVAALVGGLACVGVGLKAYAAGREKERLVQTEIIGKMVARHREDLADANRKTRELESAWLEFRQRAERSQELERSSTARALTALRRERDSLRDELSAFARGSGGPGEDSLGACHGRAETLGRLLNETLRTSEECAGDAEDLASGIRTLRGSWPVSPAASSSSSSVLSTTPAE